MAEPRYCTRHGGPPHRHRDVPVHRHRGVDTAAPGARGRVRAAPGPAGFDHAGGHRRRGRRGDPHGGRRLLRGLPDAERRAASGGGGAASAGRLPVARRPADPRPDGVAHRGGHVGWGRLPGHRRQPRRAHRRHRTRRPGRHLRGHARARVRHPARGCVAPRSRRPSFEGHRASGAPARPRGRRPPVRVPRVAFAPGAPDEPALASDVVRGPRSRDRRGRRAPERRPVS